MARYFCKHFYEDWRDMTDTRLTYRAILARITIMSFINTSAEEENDVMFIFLLSYLLSTGETGQREWCTLAYWELGGRVGRLYPVEPSTVNVFDSLHDGDGLCLATLTENHNALPTVQRTRSKIGLGKDLALKFFNLY